jgi:hypothetical protein
VSNEEGTTVLLENQHNEDKVLIHGRLDDIYDANLTIIDGVQHIEVATDIRSAYTIGQKEWSFAEPEERGTTINIDPNAKYLAVMSDGSMKGERATYSWHLFRGGSGNRGQELLSHPGVANAEACGIAGAMETLPDIPTVHFLDNQGNVKRFNSNWKSTSRTRSTWKNRSTWYGRIEKSKRERRHPYIVAWTKGHVNIETASALLGEVIKINDDVTAEFSEVTRAVENDKADKLCDDQYQAEHFNRPAYFPSADDEDYQLFIDGDNVDGPIGPALDREIEKSTMEKFDMTTPQTRVWRELRTGSRDALACKKALRADNTFKKIKFRLRMWTNTLPHNAELQKRQEHIDGKCNNCNWRVRETREHLFNECPSRNIDRCCINLKFIRLLYTDSPEAFPYRVDPRPTEEQEQTTLTHLTTSQWTFTLKRKTRELVRNKGKLKHVENISGKNKKTLQRSSTETIEIINNDTRVSNCSFDPTRFWQLYTALTKIYTMREEPNDWVEKEIETFNNFVAEEMTALYSDLREGNALQSSVVNHKNYWTTPRALTYMIKDSLGPSDSQRNNGENTTELFSVAINTDELSEGTFYTARKRDSVFGGTYDAYIDHNQTIPTKRLWTGNCIGNPEYTPTEITKAIKHAEESIKGTAPTRITLLLPYNDSNSDILNRYENRCLIKFKEKAISFVDSHVWTGNIVKNKKPGTNFPLWIIVIQNDAALKKWPIRKDFRIQWKQWAMMFLKEGEDDIEFNLELHVWEHPVTTILWPRLQKWTIWNDAANTKYDDTVEGQEELRHTPQMLWLEGTPPAILRSLMIKRGVSKEEAGKKLSKISQWGFDTAQFMWNNRCTENHSADILRRKKDKEHRRFAKEVDKTTTKRRISKSAREALKHTQALAKLNVVADPERPEDDSDQMDPYDILDDFDRWDLEDQEREREEPENLEKDSQEQITMQSWTPPAFVLKDQPDEHYIQIRRRGEWDEPKNLETIERADNKQNKHKQRLLGNNTVSFEQQPIASTVTNTHGWTQGGYNVIPSRRRSVGRPMYALNKKKNLTTKEKETKSNEEKIETRNNFKRSFERKGEG